MGPIRWPRIWAIAVLGGAMPACAARIPVEELPTPRQTLTAVGGRLGRSLPPRELGRAAARGHRLLKVLTRRERDALGRGLIRFRVDRPAFVEVAVPARSVPFWLDEQGFARTEIKLTNADGRFFVYHKYVTPGWVGLGVNGLDTSPRSHYAVFVLPRDRGPGRTPTITELTPATVRQVRAEDGVSPFVDADKPFQQLPSWLQGATLLQTSFAQRHATVLAPAE
jgi:hypothetical protein